MSLFTGQRLYTTAWCEVNKLFNRCPQENYLRPDSFVSTPHLGWAARVNNFPSCGSGEPGSQAAALLSGLGQAWQFHWSWPSWSSPPPQAALGEACGSGQSAGSHNHPRGCRVVRHPAGAALLLIITSPAHWCCLANPKSQILQNWTQIKKWKNLQRNR